MLTLCNIIYIKWISMTGKKVPLFECQECRKKFFTVKAAERASYSEKGCPGCGGSDIDLYVPGKRK